MGWGSIKHGKVELYVTLLHDADTERIQDWRRSFERASEILYHATDGQLQFGTIFVSNSAAGKQAADAHLYEFIGKSGASTNRMLLCADERFRPYVIIHEFGHYMLKLGDEYETAWSSPSYCIGDPTLQACIMEHLAEFGDQFDKESGQPILGLVNEFCGPDVGSCGPYHDKTSGNEQETRNKESCWETIEKHLGLKIPATQRQFGLATPAGHDSVDWIVLATTGQHALILDNTQRVMATAAGKGQVNGAQFWIDHFALDQDSFGLISADGQDLFHLQPLSTNNAHQATAALKANKPVPVPDQTNALQAAKAAFGKQSVPASARSVFLFSSQTLLPLNSVRALPDGVRVHTVALGADAATDQLRDLSEATHGHFESIDGALDDPAVQFAVQNHMFRMLPELPGNSELLISQPGVLPAPDQPAHLNKLTKRKPEVPTPLRSMVTVNGFDQTVLIERKSEIATFTLSLIEPASAQLTLVSPSGETFRPDTSADNVAYVERPDSGYAFYRINNPEPGMWFMRVSRRQATRVIPFELQALSRNSLLNIDFNVTQLVGTRTIRITAEVFFPAWLQGIEPPVVEVYTWSLHGGPPGKSVQTALMRRPVQKVQNAHMPMEVDAAYEASINVPRAGTYTIVGRFANAGTAYASCRCCESENGGNSAIPNFVRIKRRQLTVD